MNHAIHCRNLATLLLNAANFSALAKFAGLGHAVEKWIRTGPVDQSDQSQKGAAGVLVGRPVGSKQAIGSENSLDNPLSAMRIPGSR